MNEIIYTCDNCGYKIVNPRKKVASPKMIMNVVHAKPEVEHKSGLNSPVLESRDLCIWCLQELSDEGRLYILDDGVKVEKS